MTRWFSDACVLSRYGIATLNYGTSTGLPDAELGENLDIEGLMKTAEVYARAAKKVCGDDASLELPTDLPVPVDDGAADHLAGMAVPALTLESSVGPVELAAFGADRGVLTSTRARGTRTGRVPRAGTRSPARAAARRSLRLPRPRRGAARSSGRRSPVSPADARGAGRARGAAGILYPVIADPELRLGDALSLPTFEFEGQTLYKRLTLVFERGRDREGLLSGLPARPERGGGASLAAAS